ncbi:MAG: transporter [Sphingobacteriales bacterium]
MKKRILFILVLLVSMFPSHACDICGCGTGNYYIGNLPQFNQKFIGLRHQYKYFTTHLKDNPEQFSKDFFQTTELWGGWNLGKKWQALVFVPYNIIHQKTDDGIMNHSGLGDVALMINYKLFDLASSTGNKKLVTQQLWLGGGIKLPTGKFNVDIAGPEIIALSNSQAGTGSMDFMLNLIHNLRISKFGLSTNLNYKINNTNLDEYKFGNRFTASSFAFYSISKNETIISPNIGMMYEHSSFNTLEKTKVEETNGYLLAGSAGIEVGFNKISVGANIQLPFAQDFASGQTKLSSRGMIHLSFSF